MSSEPPRVSHKRSANKFYNTRRWHIALVPIFEINGSGEEHSQVQKIEKFCLKCFSLPRLLFLLWKTLLQKG